MTSFVILFQLQVACADPVWRSPPKLHVRFCAISAGLFLHRDFSVPHQLDSENASAAPIQWWEFLNRNALRGGFQNGKIAIDFGPNFVRIRIGLFPIQLCRHAFSAFLLAKTRHPVRHRRQPTAAQRRKESQPSSFFADSRSCRRYDGLRGGRATCAHRIFS